MASMKKVNMATSHHTYQCKMCGKKDRRGRMVAHILKKHASLDSVPYLCELCNFRCTEKKELFLHLECYKRHTDQVAKTGIKDLSGLLHKSEHPIDLNEYMVDLDAPRRTTEEPDQSIFEPQDSDPVLPDWLEEFSLDKTPQPSRVLSIPSPKRHQPQLERSILIPSSIHANDDSYQLLPATGQRLPAAKPHVGLSNIQCANLTSPVSSLLFAQPTPIRSHGAAAMVTTPVNGFPIPDTTPTRPPGGLPTTQGATFPTLNLADLVDSPSMHYDQNFVNFSTMNKHQPPAATAIKSQSGSVTALSTMNTPVRTRINTKSTGTPLQDELFVVDDSPLDQSYTKDPLFIEGRLLEDRRQDNQVRPSVKTSTSATQVDMPAPIKQQTSQDKILLDILHAIEANGRQIHGVNRNLRSIQDEVHSLHRAIQSLERTCARSNSAAPDKSTSASRRRSRTPLFHPESNKRKSPACKENIKSSVKRVKGSKK